MLDIILLLRRPDVVLGGIEKKLLFSGSLKERCALSEKGTVSSVLLYKLYCLWCTENGVEADGQKTFYGHVRIYSAGITEGKVIADGSRVNGFRGIALKQADDAKNGAKQAE